MQMIRLDYLNIHGNDFILNIVYLSLFWYYLPPGEKKKIKLFFLQRKHRAYAIWR